MGRRQREKLLVFVEAVVSEGVSILTGGGMPEEMARQAATQLAKRLCWRFGKSYMYVPASVEFERTERDAEIYRQYGEDGPDGARRFTRDRAEQLAEQHDLTVQQIYAIRRLQHHLELTARQAPLPAPGFEHPKNPA